MIFVGELRIVDEPMMPIRRHWICPTCQNGEMIYTGAYQPVSPPNYAHACNNPGCRAVWHSKKKYPCIEFVPIPMPPPPAHVGE
jgi:hypothetical protein